MVYDETSASCASQAPVHGTNELQMLLILLKCVGLEIKNDQIVECPRVISLNPPSRPESE